MITITNYFFKYNHLFILMCLCFSCTSKTKKDIINEHLTNINFKQEEYDFGNISLGKSVSIVFEFSNTGEYPLLIKEISTSCGCTVPKWSKEIVKPNENGEIKIVYDAKYPGVFNKTVNVVFNGKESPKQLTIRGKVPYPAKKILR